VGDPQGLRRVGAGLALLALAGMLGCATTVGGLRKSFREPGEHFQSFPEEVWSQYDCDGRKLPWFKIEKIELLPRRLRAGDEFNHRIVYVLCPDAPTAVVTGRLDTRILFRGRSIVTETDPAYEIKPGRWIVDAFVSVPPRAEAGIYSMELAFEGRSLAFTERLTFLVEDREQH
jgi:hypothetical protein